jgi:hypothetical protein
MRVTLFTGNQPRHIAFVERLAAGVNELFAVHECTTVFPGRVPDFYRRSTVMQDYFSRVLEAERRVFGATRFGPPGVRHLLLRMGDLSEVPLDALAPALNADAYVVFGASYIRGALCDFLVNQGAVNLHMGVSPYYRGSSTNFWALYDRRPDYVGATIHLLTRGLDSGPILCHVFPAVQAWEPFELGMRAVENGQKALMELLKSGRIAQMTPAPQDRSKQLRYTRTSEFTDEVAAEYLQNLLTPDDVRSALTRRDLPAFIRPVVG